MTERLLWLDLFKNYILYKRYICRLKRSFKYSRNKRKQTLFLLNRHNFDLMGIEVKIKIKRSALTFANLNL